MEMFLVSNLIISSLAIVFNYWAKASIKASFYVCGFALLCWIVPLSLIRNLFPESAYVDVSWIAPQTFELSEPVDKITTSLDFQPSLLQIFIVAGLVGLLVFIRRLLGHLLWSKTLRTKQHEKAMMVYKGIPVYAGNWVKNALLSGYRQPKIWINPRLLKSKNLEIVLEHEATHARMKDNYWLLALEAVQSFYWWNPLVKKLSQNMNVLIEARCDFKASQNFAGSYYLERLAKLMLTSQPESMAQFESAVVSKNPDINRMKYLQENPQMNFLAKLNLSLFSVISLVILSIPIASYKALANNSAADTQHPNAVSEIDTGEDIDSTVFNSEPNQSDGDFGALMAFNISHVLMINGVKNTETSELTIWAHFNEKSIIKMKNDWEIRVIPQDQPEGVYIASELFVKQEDKSMRLIASPEILTEYEQQASIMMGSDDEMWTFAIKTRKTQKPEQAN